MLVYQRVIQLYSARFSQMYGNCGAYIYIYMCITTIYLSERSAALVFFLCWAQVRYEKSRDDLGYILVYTCYMKHVGYCGRILPNLVQVGFLG
jgi:hypothetical protein